MIKNLKKINKRAFKRSLFGSISRILGVSLGASAGSILYELIGNNLKSYFVASFLALISFILILFSEYNRENS